MATKFGENFKLYKAKNSGDGAASQFNIGSDKDCVFLEMANQKGKDGNGNANFDWGNKIRFKLGVSDIGEFLAVTTGVKDGVGPFDTGNKKHKGLYHANQSGNAILYFGKDKNGRFQIYLSVKRDNKQTIVKHAMTDGEVCVLGVLLRQAVEIIHKWT